MDTYQDPWSIKRATSNCPICGEITFNNHLCEECAESF